jgi:hypothetical protein
MLCTLQSLVERTNPNPKPVPNSKPVPEVLKLGYAAKAAKLAAARPEPRNGAIDKNIACIADSGGDQCDSARAGTGRVMPVEPSPRARRLSQSPRKRLLHVRLFPVCSSLACF